jgi:RNA polymerase sigma-70 factor (ECF subfamily)
MSDPRPADVTALLLAWNAGDPSALEKLTIAVHDELRRLARHYMRQERPGHTLQPTALVNEAYVRLVDATRVQWQNRSHFFGVSARLMRQILVDLARTRGAAKRGLGAAHLNLDDVAIPVAARDEDFVALDQALSMLAATDARKAQVVEMRFFGGMTVEETAEVLAVSPETVKRDWSLAKAWLKRQLTS